MWQFATAGERRFSGKHLHGSEPSFYDQMIIAYDRMMSVGAVLSTPVIDGDTIYFGSWDGQVYAVG